MSIRQLLQGLSWVKIGICHDLSCMKIENRKTFSEQKRSLPVFFWHEADREEAVCLMTCCYSSVDTSRGRGERLEGVDPNSFL